MYSIEELKEINKRYDEETDKLRLFNEQVREVNDNVDLDEIKSKLSYKEAKELYKLILSRSNNKARCEEIKKIVEDKKIEEYPQIKDVHYYPIIKNIDFLSNKEKISLDRFIKDSYRNRRYAEDIEDLDDRIKDFLIDNNIIEKRYIFHCDCGSFECDDKVVTQERFDKLKDYWIKEEQGLTTHEEDEEMRYGCFETGCWNDGSVEICSLDDFNDNLRRIDYKVLLEPDMTLDNI